MPVEDIPMKKCLLLTSLAAFALVTISPMLAANTTGTAGAPAGDSKVKSAAQAVGRGVMWGPRKLGAGLKKVGDASKKAVGKGN